MRAVRIDGLEQDPEAGVEGVLAVIAGNQWLEITHLLVLSQSETLALSLVMEFIRRSSSSQKDRPRHCLLILIKCRMKMLCSIYADFILE
jgi:hypothetical protein